MNWPENYENIECVGFSASLLSTLAEAWDNKHVSVLANHRGRMGDTIWWTFDYLDFRYRIDCLDETVTKNGGAWSIYTPWRIERIAKVISGSVVENYPITNPKGLPPRYEGVWGSF